MINSGSGNATATDQMVHFPQCRSHNIIEELQGMSKGVPLAKGVDSLNSAAQQSKEDQRATPCQQDLKDRDVPLPCDNRQTLSLG